MEQNIIPKSSFAGFSRGSVSDLLVCGLQCGDWPLDGKACVVVESAVFRLTQGKWFEPVDGFGVQLVREENTGSFAMIAFDYKDSEEGDICLDGKAVLVAAGSFEEVKSRMDSELQLIGRQGWFKEGEMVNGKSSVNSLGMGCMNALIEAQCEVL